MLGILSLAPRYMGRSSRCRLRAGAADQRDRLPSVTAIPLKVPASIGPAPQNRQKPTPQHANIRAAPPITSEGKEEERMLTNPTLGPEMQSSVWPAWLLPGANWPNGTTPTSSAVTSGFA